MPNSEIKPGIDRKGLQHLVQGRLHVKTGLQESIKVEFSSAGKENGVGVYTGIQSSFKLCPVKSRLEDKSEITVNFERKLFKLI